MLFVVSDRIDVELIGDNKDDVWRSSLPPASGSFQSGRLGGVLQHRDAADRCARLDEISASKRRVILRG